MAGSEDRLQQYFDGELTGDDADAMRRELEESSEVRAKLEGLAHLRTLLTRAAEERGDEVDSEALFAGITAKLAESSGDDDPMFPASREPEPARPKLGVIPGGKAPEKRTPKRANVVWIGTAAVLAIAAAVLLAVVRPFGTGDTEPVQPLAKATPQGSEVVDVDFGYSTGAIFSVEGREGERIAVVWISDDKPLVDESVERIQ